MSNFQSVGGWYNSAALVLSCRRMQLKVLRGDLPPPGRLGDKSVSRRVDGSHCSNDSGLFIDPDTENDPHSTYDER